MSRDRHRKLARSSKSDSALHDTENRLIIRPAMCLQTLLGPADRPLNGRARDVFQSAHPPAGIDQTPSRCPTPNRSARQYSLPHPEEFPIHIDMAFEPDAFIADAIQMSERKNLKPAAVGEDRAWPSHEFMQITQGGHGFFAGAKHEVICIAKNDLENRWLRDDRERFLSPSLAFRTGQNAGVSKNHRERWIRGRGGTPVSRSR